MDFLNRIFRGEAALRTWLWISLVLNMLIVVTGSIVRVTASGLGCPTWPQCTETSYVPQAEYGWHGVIEFGNRLLTFVLLFAAAGTFATAWRTRGYRTPLFWLTLAVLVGIPMQGVVGGITVLSQLNPWVVALHLVLSAVLVVLCVAALVRAGGRSPEAVGPSGRILVLVTFVAMALTTWLGTVVTGAGPHAGDAGAARNDLDILTVARIHSFSAWLLVLSTVACVWMFRRYRRARHASVALLAACLIQGAIGYWQYFTGVPAALVVAHLAGMTLVVAAAAWLLMVTTSEPEAPAAEPQVNSGSMAMTRNSSAK